MKHFLMILVAMALAGCGFEYIPPNNASETAGDKLADSRDSNNDGDGKGETKFNPPLFHDADTKPPPADTDIASINTDNGDTTPNNDSDIDHPLPDTDAGTEETTPPVEIVDTDSADTPNDDTLVDTDGKSNSDSTDTAETEPDTLDTQDAEAETTLPCI